MDPRIESLLSAQESALSALEELRHEIGNLMRLIDGYENDPASYVRQVCVRDLSKCMQVLRDLE